MSIMRVTAVVYTIAIPQSNVAAGAAAQPQSYATNGDPALAAFIGEALEGNPRVHGALLEFQAAQSRIL